MHRRSLVSSLMVERVRSLLIVLAIVGPIGCGGQGIYPVRGRIVYEDGQPAMDATHGTIVLTSGELKASGSGFIQDDCTFRLTMKQPGDGAIPGRYTAYLIMDTPDGEDPQEVADYERRVKEFGLPFVDPIYCDPKKSPLAVVVEPKKNDLTVQIKRVQKTTHTPVIPPRRY
jgi:hypothetical protein